MARVRFGAFVLDVPASELRKRATPLKVPAQSIAVLKALLERPGDLVTREQLRHRLWPDDTFVDFEHGLNAAVRRLRKAVGDSARAPKFIETLSRRGYRFIGVVHAEPPAPLPAPAGSAQGAIVSPAFSRRDAALVFSAGHSLAPEANAASGVSLPGRQAAFSRLMDAFRHALHGQRQMLCVSGELGIGKTAIVQAFTTAIRPAAWVARGHSIPSHGPETPYLPLREVLAELCCDDGARPLDAFIEHAPSWAPLLPRSLRRASVTEPQGADRDGLALQFVLGIEHLTRLHPVVIVFEDLHWCDNSTVALIARLMQRTEPARLLVIGTYRPAERTEEQPYFRRVCGELETHFRLVDIELAPLSPEVVSEYLTAALGRCRDIRQASDFFHSRSGGNPLFLRHLMDYFIGENLLRQEGDGWFLDGPAAERVVPPTLRSGIESDFERLLPDEQRVLGAASVMGRQFTALPVCSAAQVDETVVRDALGRLSRRRRFIEATRAADAADGDACPGWAFLHQLYRDVVYEALPLADRIEMHRCVAEEMARLGDGVSVEIASHLARAAQYQRAAEFYAQGACEALRVNANSEARAAVDRGLSALAPLPEAPDRQAVELRLRLYRCTALSNSLSMVDPAVEDAYQQVARLGLRMTASPELVPALLGVARYESLRGRTQYVSGVIEHAHRVASQHSPQLVPIVAFHTASDALYRGAYRLACEAAERALNADSGVDSVPLQGFDHVSGAWMLLAWCRCIRAQPRAALGASRRTLELSMDSDNPVVRGVAQGWSAPILELLGHADESLALAEAAHHIARQHRVPQLSLWASTLTGWLRARRGDALIGATTIRDAIEAQQSAGLLAWLPIHFAWLAEAWLLANRPADGGRAALDGLTLAADTGVHNYDAELYRFAGEAAAELQSSAPGDAVALEQPFHQAIAVAGAQEAGLFELRARIGLARLRIRQGRCGEAIPLLTVACAASTEGDALPDLRMAQALLADCGRR